MSGVLKGVGKVFKKVVKIAKKVAIPALAIGAVVLTGGAALGALPALGTMLGSIGISGTLASVLGGAISASAIGAVTGGLGAAIQGKSVLKGVNRGFITGAVTGGVLGGVGAVGPDGVLAGLGIGAKSAETAATQGLGAIGGTASPTVAASGSAMSAAGQLAPQVGQAAMVAQGLAEAPIVITGTKLAAAGGGLGALTAAAAPVVATAIPAALNVPDGFYDKPAPKSGGGMDSTTKSMLIEGAMKGIGSIFGGSEADDRIELMNAEYDRIAQNYTTDGLYGYPRPDYSQPIGYAQQAGKWQIDKETGKVVRI